MNRHRSTPEQKRKRLLYVAIVLVALFVLRLVLLQVGVISGPKALSEEDLTNDFRTSQVLVTSGDTTARGTILQISTPSGIGQKDKHKTIYVLTTSDIADSVQSLEEQQKDSGEESSLDNSCTICTITFSDGSTASGSYVSVNDKIGAGVVSCTDEDLSFAADSVFFSENILYQMTEGTDAYYQSAAGEESADSYPEIASPPVKGEYLNRSASMEGFDIDLMKIRLAEGDSVAAGSGIFTDSGYFLGMALQTESDGTVTCLPGNDAVDYFRTNH